MACGPTESLEEMSGHVQDGLQSLGGSAAATAATEGLSKEP